MGTQGGDPFQFGKSVEIIFIKCGNYCGVGKLDMQLLSQEVKAVVWNLTAEVCIRNWVEGRQHHASSENKQ